MAFLTRRRDTRPPMENLELLTTAADEIELSMIRGLLDEYGIALYVRDREGSSYLRVVAGYTVFGTDVYVDRDDLPRAKELIAAYLSSDAEIADEDVREAFAAADAAEAENASGSRVKLWYVILAIVLICLAAFIVGRL